MTPPKDRFVVFSECIPDMSQVQLRRRDNQFRGAEAALHGTREWLALRFQ
jgi:hypothetical protein